MRFAAFLALLAVTAACSSPPVKEHQQAADAIAQAEAAGAARYAPDDLKTAKQAFAQYDDAVTSRDYRLALNRALVARDSAYDAVKHAGENQAAMRKQYDALVATTQSLIRQATAALAAHPPAHTATRLRQDIRSANTAMQEAGATLKTGDLPSAIKRLSGIPDQFHRDLAGGATTGRRGHAASGAPATPDSSNPDARTYAVF